MRASSFFLIALALVTSPATADVCKDEAKKRLTYLALDAAHNYQVQEYSEAAIKENRYVVENARTRLDKRAAYLSCRNITGMLHHAGLLEDRPGLLEGCDDTAVSSFLGSIMPEEAESKNGEQGASTPDGVAPGDYLPIVRISPVYPRDMLRDGINGVVIVEFTVATNGTVANAKSIASSNKRFEKPALQAARRFKYKPRVIDGERVDTTGVEVSITFSLVGNDELYTAFPQCDS